MNKFFDDINSLSEVAISDDLVENQDIKKSNKLGISELNKLKKLAFNAKKKLNESIELIDELNNILSGHNVEKNGAVKTTNNQKKIKIVNIYEPFAKEYLKNCETTDEQFIKGLLKQLYFKNNILIESSSEMDVDKILNISEYDSNIIKIAREQNKIGLLPTTKDIPIFSKFLELKHSSILYKDKNIDLNNAYSIKNNPELFTIEMIKNEERYKINREFYDILKEYGINITLNKAVKSRTIEEAFKKYLTFHKKLFIKINNEYEKYIKIINESNTDNYLTYNGIIYMNRNKFDEILKNVKDENNSTDFNKDISNKFELEGLTKYNIQTFKNKIESSYK
jgi:hypothetical protein